MGLISRVSSRTYRNMAAKRSKTTKQKYAADTRSPCRQSPMVWPSPKETPKIRNPMLQDTFSFDTSAESSDNDSISSQLATWLSKTTCSPTRFSENELKHQELRTSMLFSHA